MSKIMIGVPYLEGSDINPDGSLKSHVGSGKPVVLMLQGNFCGYCNSAKPAFQDFCSSIKNAVGVTVQMDGDTPDKQAATMLAAVCKEPGVPRFLGFDSSGKFVKLHSGGRDVKSLQEFAASL